MFAYTKEDIITKLKAIGICEGDDIFIHSNIGFFGKLKDCSTQELLCKTFTEALINTVGEEGTIILPAFTYSFCKNEIYDPLYSKSACGILTEYIRRLPQADRTTDPNFSVAVIGKHQVDYCTDPAKESFGRDSFWERFMNNSGKLICMNFDCGSTFVHYVEKSNEVEYRYNKAFNGIIRKEGREYKDYGVHFVYDLDKPGDGPDFSRLDRMLRRYGLCRMEKLGKGAVLAFHSTKYYDFISEMLKKRPRFLTKNEEV